VVRETTEQVIERVRDFRRSVLIAGSGATSVPAEDTTVAAVAVNPKGPARG